MVELRPYQEEAVSAIAGEWGQGRKKTLLVLPTGTGKTIVFAKVAERVVSAGERVLVLAHREELLQQAADKIKTATGLGCAVEKAEQSSHGSFMPIVVGSVQSLMRDKRLATFEKGHFETIIVDEAHHSISDSYQKVLSHFSEAKVLGVTATPDRGDKKNLGKYFESLAYEYPLRAAIKDGFLCKIEAQTIPLELDLHGVTLAQGDFKVSELDRALDPYLERIADEMVAAGCLDKKTVIFLPLIATAKKFASILRSRRFACSEINGMSKDRSEILRRFACGEIRTLCNAMLLTEGWDQPDVDCIVVLRPTKIRSLYAQMVGRGTRIHPGKDSLLLLDFLWHTERHELCRPAHLIAGSEDVAKKLTEKLEEAACPLDIEEVEEAAAGDVVADRERALAKKLEEMKHKKRKLVDPLQFELSIQAEDLASYTPTFGWEMSPASSEQLDTLEKFGINADDVDCAGKASLLIDKLMKRQSEGLARPRQIRELEKRGFMHVGTWSFEAASNMISRISANGWRVPSAVDPYTYTPSSPVRTDEFEPFRNVWSV